MHIMIASRGLANVVPWEIVSEHTPGRNISSAHFVAIAVVGLRRDFTDTGERLVNSVASQSSEHDI